MKTVIYGSAVLAYTAVYTTVMRSCTAVCVAMVFYPLSARRRPTRTASGRCRRRHRTRHENNTRRSTLTRTRPAKSRASTVRNVAERQSLTREYRVYTRWFLSHSFCPHLRTFPLPSLPNQNATFVWNVQNDFDASTCVALVTNYLSL